VSRRGRMVRGRIRGRGYAVPVVLLVAMAGGAMIAVMLNRSGTLDLASRRQRTASVEHHLSLGVQETAATWLGAVGNLDMGALLEDDGLACTAKLDNRREIRIYFEDAQGALNTDEAIYTPAQREVVARVEELLGGNTPQGRTQGRDDDAQFGQSSLTRRTGPKGINVNSAPERVLIALASALLEDDAAGVRVADALIRGRAEDPLRAGEARSAVSATGIEGASDILDWLVYESALWRVRADLMEPPGPGRRPVLVRRYTGVAVRDLGGTGGSVPPQAMFEGWKRVEDPVIR